MNADDKERQRKIKELRDRITAQPNPSSDLNKVPGQGLPVTIVRPHGIGQDLTVELVLAVVRTFLIRRALRRFWPGNDLSFRDVWVGVAAIRTLQVGSQYAYWTREPLGWDRRIAQAVKDLLKEVRG